MSKKKIIKLRIVLVLSLAVLLPAGIHAQTIDVSAEGEPFEHFWSLGVGAGRVGEALRAGWQDQFGMVMQHCGYRYIRMHALFGDDMFVYKRRYKENPYNFQYIDEVFDRLLEMGAKPFVELSFFPKDLAAKNSKTQFWYKACFTPDVKKYPRWGELVRATLGHWVERYGIDEVSSWYFEVWNEPDLTDGFFDGTREEYFELYKITAQAVKQVDPRLRVGGPATSNFVADGRHDGPVLDYKLSKTWPVETVNDKPWKGPWIKEFLSFCEQEDLPLDFLSSHPYPMDASLEPDEGGYVRTYRYVLSTRDDLLWLRKALDESAFKGRDIFVTEWNVSSKGRDLLHDVLPPGATAIKAFMECAGLAKGLFWWTFTDIFEEGGGGWDIFHGGFGQVNFQGIVKPVFHAFRLLNGLGDRRLYYQDPLVVTKDSRTGKVSALGFCYPEEYLSCIPSEHAVDSYMEASSRRVDFTLTGLKKRARFTLELIDDDHGNAYKRWQQMGSPHSPTREQISELKESAWDTVREEIRADRHGKLHISRELGPWSFFLLKEI